MEYYDYYALVGAVGRSMENPWLALSPSLGCHVQFYRVPESADIVFLIRYILLLLGRAVDSIQSAEQRTGNCFRFSPNAAKSNTHVNPSC